MQFWKKALLTETALTMLASTVLGCARNEVKDYAKQQNLPPAIVQELKPLEPKMDGYEKAIIDEIYKLPQSLQWHQVTLDYLKKISADKRITSDEISGLYELDHEVGRGDGLSLRKEMELGTDPLKLNPNVKYAIDKNLTAYIEQIKPLDEDGKQDEKEKSSIDTAYKVSQLKISDNAKNSNILYVLSGKANEFESAYNSLKTVSDKTLKDYLELGIDDSVISYITLVSGLTDKEFAKYLIESKSYIQDKEFTEPEKKFHQTFDSYIPTLTKMHLDLPFELLRLPDLKKIDAEDFKALKNIHYLAGDARNKTAFEAILKEGIKDKRKYASLLEALFLIAYEKEFDKYNPLKDFSIERLLNEAWRDSRASDNYSSYRWGKFEDVVDRLNSDNLVRKYMIDQIKFILRSNHLNIQTAQGAFDLKKGHCADHAMFAAWCLGNNGYESYIIASPRDKDIFFRGGGHAASLYKEDGLFYTIDSGKPSTAIAVKRGPFKTIEEAVTGSLYSSWSIYVRLDIYGNIIEFK